MMRSQGVRVLLILLAAVALHLGQPGEAYAQMCGDVCGPTVECETACQVCRFPPNPDGSCGGPLNWSTCGAFVGPGHFNECNPDWEPVDGWISGVFEEWSGSGTWSAYAAVVTVWHDQQQCGDPDFESCGYQYLGEASNYCWDFQCGGQLCP
jgi:hypothetical protein